MKKEDEFLKSLNDSILSNISIEELETRLEIEGVDIRNEMWTGCSCADYCPHCSSYCPAHNPDCPYEAPSGICPVDWMKV
jgi:hypothetical protein